MAALETAAPRLREIISMSQESGRLAIVLLRRTPISLVRTHSRSRNRGKRMRKAMTLFELAIGGVLTVAVAAYIAQGALLIVQSLL
jgi:hypothetical protein